MSYFLTLKIQLAAAVCSWFNIEPTVVVQEVTKTIIEPVGPELRFKPFFIHKLFQQPGETKRRARRGMTVYVQPGDTWREIKVQHAFCSIKDSFCKKFGREQALKRDPVILNTRELPDYLATLAAEGYGMPKNSKWLRAGYTHYLKYIV